MDYITIDEAIILDSSLSRLKICLPTPLTRYVKYFEIEPPRNLVTFTQSRAVKRQLYLIQQLNPRAIIESDSAPAFSYKDYYQSKGTLVNLASAIIAFSVNDDPALKEVIDQAQAKGIPVTLHQFTI